MDDYRVTENTHGVLIFGPVLLLDLKSLAAGWEERGWTIMAPGIAQALGATFAVTSPESFPAWQAEIDAAAAKKAGEDRELAWVTGTDTGLSSCCILARLGDSAMAVAKALQRVHGATWPHPEDPDDLGRCVRLLDRFPDWRKKLPMMNECGAKWAA